MEYNILFYSYNSRPPGAVAIKYEFDQHNDTYFQSLWPQGIPEPSCANLPILLISNPGFKTQVYYVILF